MRSWTYIAIASVTLYIGLIFPAEAKSYFLYKELNLIGGYSDADKWAWNSSTLKNSIGFEYYRKFSSEYGDYLTADIQMRLVYDAEETLENAWAVELHNAWLEYKLTPGVYLRGGHFDPAFGLEPITDTHGTILQTLAGDNIGFKKDWGIGMRGSMAQFDYRLAMQLGSGMSIRKEDGSYLLTARIGSPAGRDLEYGASFLYGRVLRTGGMMTFPRNRLLSDEAVWKKRVGFDCQYNWNSLLVRSEIAYGTDDNDDALGYLVGADYSLPKHENWQAKAQFRSWINDVGERKSDDSTMSFSLAYKLNRDITLRAALVHDLNMADEPEDTKILFQFYYYGL